MIGRVIGPYRLDALLGEGASAKVFRAWHRALEKSFALKLYTYEVGHRGVDRERFMREAKALSAIAHPNVVRLIDFGVADDGLPYLVMEWVEGRPLIDEMRSRVQLERIVALAVQIAAGLRAVHDAGAIHRDLKPANIMVLNGGEPKIVDFGLVSGDPEMFPALTRPGAILGTPYYMSPEQVLKEDVTDRSDLYSFGVILYEMLTEEMAFPGRGVVEILQAQLGPRPPKLEPRYGELGALVDRLIAKESAERPKSAAEVHELLKRMSLAFAATPIAMTAIESSDTRVLRSAPTEGELTRVTPGDLTESDAGGVATPAKPTHRRRGSLAAALGASLVALFALRQWVAPAPLASPPLSPPPSSPPPLVIPTPPPATPTVAPREIAIPAAIADTATPQKGRRPKKAIDPPPSPPPLPPSPPVAPPSPTLDPPEVVLARLGRLIRNGSHRLGADDDARYFDLRERVAKAKGDPGLARELEAFERELLGRPKR